MSQTEQVKGPSEHEPAGLLAFVRPWELLRKRWRTIAVLTSVVLAVAFVWTYRAPKIYSANASVVIDTTAPQVLEGVKDVVELGTASYWNNKEFYETQYRIIASQAVAERVVARLGLAADPEYQRVAQDSRSSIAALIRRQLHVNPVRDSRIAIITVEDRRPERAALIANAFADAYIEYNLDYKLEGTKNASTWLAEQETNLRSKLEGSEMALYAFKRDKNLLAVSLDDKQSMTSQNLARINDKLADVKAKRLELESARKLVSAARNNPEEKDSLPEVRQNLTVQRLRQSLVDLLVHRSELESKYGDKHPRYIEAQSQIASMRKEYEGEVDRILRGMDKQYNALLDTEHSLVQWMEREKQQAIELSRVELEYKPLARNAENTSKVYGMINQRQKETNLSGLMKANNVRILERAVVPHSHVRPQLALNMFIAAFLGLFSGVGIALLLELADNTVKSQVDAERLLDAPVLGAIPIIHDEDAQGVDAVRVRDLQMHHDPKSLAAECYRSLRTNLLFLSPDRKIRTIVLTSPGPQEGKTTNVINLGITMSQAGGTTLLIDVDMRRPRLHKSFQISNERGLSTAILGEVELSAVIQPTEVPGLSVLPCGPIPPNPAELLHTDRFRAILAECGNKFDRVILDSPPTSAVTDPAILGNLVDGVVLVLRGGKTTRHAAFHARRQLASAKATLLGLVLNQVDFSSRAYGGYYSYYYRAYSAYASSDQRARA